MASFEVTGGISLKGEITPQGAKNEALQIISAVLLTSEKVTIHNIPRACVATTNTILNRSGEKPGQG